MGGEAKSWVRKGIPTGKVYCTQMGGVVRRKTDHTGTPILVYYQSELQTCRAVNFIYPFNQYSLPSVELHA